jgi:hypothetical protein
MKTRLAAIVVGLLAVGAPAFAQDSLFSKLFAQSTPPATSPKPAHAKAHQPAAKKPAAQPAQIAAKTEPAAPVEQTGTVTHKPTSRAKAERGSVNTNANGTMPAAERLAIQADLAWIGDYTGAGGGDLDQHAIEAIKTFQKARRGRETGVLNEQERALLAAAAKAPQEAVGWQLLDDPATGARLGLPEKLVASSGGSRTGSRWASGHGQIQIETFRLREAALPALFEAEKKVPRQRRVEWSALKPDSFIISGMQGLKKFVMRAEASGGEVRGITILYDQATEGIMAPVAVAMVDTFQGFPDPNAGPPPGKRRKVEYGTAIVVDRSGDFITVAQVTEECEAIMVPGFGHAERIAVDQMKDLALIRVYGARNLSPAALAGESGKSDDLTLVGVADPLAQEGGAAVTTASAHLTAQGVEPAPRLGFSGAAAIDAQGRFAGMVELKSPMVAGIGTGTQQATLVSADAVREFLAAHAVAPAAGHGAIDQSVVRVICVRK